MQKYLSVESSRVEKRQSNAARLQSALCILCTPIEHLIIGHSFGRLRSNKDKYCGSSSDLKLGIFFFDLQHFAGIFLCDIYPCFYHDNCINLGSACSLFS